MVWKKIKGYENEYEISKKGDVRRLDDEYDGHIVQSTIASNGKLQVQLWKNGLRKNFMLHNLYAEAFEISVKKAMRILYEGFEGDTAAKDRVKRWLLEKIHECEQSNDSDAPPGDEILYLKSFLRELNED